MWGTETIEMVTGIWEYVKPGGNFFSYILDICVDRYVEMVEVEEFHDLFDTL